MQGQKEDLSWYQSKEDIEIQAQKLFQDGSFHQFWDMRPTLLIYYPKKQIQNLIWCCVYVKTTSYFDLPSMVKWSIGLSIELSTGES